MALGTDAVAINALLVAALSLAIAGAAYRVLVRTGNRAVWYVVAAFSVLALKNAAKGILLLAGEGSALSEFAFSCADLATVVLIAIPILRRTPEARVAGP